MKVSNNLGNRLLNAEKFVGKEIVNFYGFVFVDTFSVRIVVYVDVSDTGFHDDFMQSRMRQLSDGGISFDFFEVSQQIPVP